MQLIDSFTEAKTGNKHDSEDTYFVNEHFACVIDGATNVSGISLEGTTPGKLAAQTVKEAMASLQGTEDIEEIIVKINLYYENIYKFYDKSGVEITNSFMRPSASAIIFSKHHRKIWLIGDCQCYLDGQQYTNIKRVDQVFEEVRSIIIKSELVQGVTEETLLHNDIGFETIKPLIQRQYQFQNGDPACNLSYGVINGQSIPLNLIKTIEVPEEIETISFASDGYPLIFETLTETEAYLQRMLEIDPLCINENMATKGIQIGNVSFDDRTYIRVKI